MFCTQCGAKMAENAKFCAGCGAAVVSAQAAPPQQSAPTPVEPSPTAVPMTTVAKQPLPQEDEPSPYAAPGVYSADEADVVDTPWWKKPLPLIALGILALVFLLYGFRDFWLGMDPQPAASNMVVAGGEASGNSTVPVGTSFYAVRKAKLRDKPSTEGSVVKGEVARGTLLNGALVEGTDGKSQWLKIDNSGYYISAANISNEAPVALSAQLNRSVTLDEQTDVRTRPSDDAAPTDSLVSGTAVDAVGVANGWIEITLKKGGVGYIKPSEKSANFGLLSGKAPEKTAAASVNFDQVLKLDPASCGFGAPVESIFSAMADNADKAPFSVSGFEGLFKATRANPANPETSSIVAPVSGQFRGLHVTGLFKAYEGQGLYFSDSVDTVGSALAEMGFSKDDKGNWAFGDEGVGAYISNQSGKTQLYCGA